jgi:hypothetical protein
MNTEKGIPTLSIDLIKSLAESYPNTLPWHLDFTEKEVAYRMGQRDLIVKLLNDLEDDDEKF